METIKLSVYEREERGNGPARRLRAKGLIPAVTYGKGKTPQSIALDVEDLKVAMTHGHNVILELEFGQPEKAAKGAKAKVATRYAVVKQYQMHPTKRQVLHVDLHEVDLGEEIEATVTVELVGTPAGVQDGGVVEWERREVNVRALPSTVPEMLELDISELHIGHHLSVDAIKPPKGVTIIDDPETLIVSLVPPRVEVVEPGEVGAEAEPEVVGSQKSEE
jgi:large subunit ribosomal protein L25